MDLELSIADWTMAVITLIPVLALVAGMVMSRRGQRTRVPAPVRVPDGRRKGRG